MKVVTFNIRMRVDTRRAGNCVRSTRFHEDPPRVNANPWIVLLSWLAVAPMMSLATAAESLPKKVPELVGVKECAACHSVPSPIYQQLGVTTFIRLVEASEWLQSDKHAHAYQLVCQESTSEANCDAIDNQSNQRSRAICQNLGWTKGDGNFEKQCLTCHAGLDHRTPLDSIDRSALQFGVQCEACHGPGSEYTRRENHQQVEWREKDPRIKAELGLYDLTSPSVTARICYSCHIGDLEQNRFVTHPMYAAGHPALPAVDLQVFLDAMPPHWEVLQKKPYPAKEGDKPPATFAKQAEYYQAHFGADHGTDADFRAWRESYHRTRRSLIGSLVANDIGIRLIHDAAERAELWGDFAIYDCTGCHHELHKTNPRWRPLDQTPGRAYPAMWWTLNHQTALPTTKMVSTTIAKDFLAAFDRVPFGDRNRLVALRSTHLDELASRLADRQAEERKPMTEQEVRNWLVHLYESRRDSLGDYWTAKQTAWMFQVAIQELVDHQAIPDKPSLEKLDELSKELELDLRIDQRASVLDHQAKSLSKVNEFDVSKCKELLEELSQIVAPISGSATRP